MKILTAQWNEAIEAYLIDQRSSGAPETTIRCRRQHLANLARGIGAEPFEITPAQLVLWTGRQRWALETRRGRRTTFRSFYRWAIAMGLTDVDASQVLPRVKSKPGVARPAPDRVYLEALMRSKPRVRLWLRLAAELGLRRAEIAAVHSDDLIEDLVGWSLLVHGKGQRERVVPLTPGIAAELRTMPAGYAFPGDRDGHVSPEWLGKQASRAMEGHWTIHTLRHRFAARTYAIDADLFVVQELLGHASPATTRRYVPRASAAKARRLVLAAASGEAVKPALTVELRSIGATG